MDLGQILKFLPHIIKGISLAESIKGAKGPEKKRIAIASAVRDGLQLAEDVTGADLANEEAAAVLADHVIEGVFAGKKAIEAGKQLRTPDGTPTVRK